MLLQGGFEDLCASGFPSSMFLGQCGLPGPLGLITASVFLICRFVRSSSCSLPSSLSVGVG
jgi:hypothetical protein